MLFNEVAAKRTMNNFVIKPIEHPRYKRIVFSINHESPSEYLCEIQLELEKQFVCGWIIFDLVLCNGNNFNRYIEEYFNGRNFSDGQSSIVVQDNITKQSSREFYENNDIINNSILTKTQKFLLKKGLL